MQPFFPIDSTESEDPNVTQLIAAANRILNMQPFSPIDSTKSKDSNVTRLQQLDQYNIRSGTVDLDELAAITLDYIECFGFIIVGVNTSSLPGELRSVGATLLDASATGLKAIDTLLQGLRFARKFHKKLDRLTIQAGWGNSRRLTDGEWEELGPMATKVHFTIQKCLGILREIEGRFLSLKAPDVPNLGDSVLVMEIPESHKYTASLSDIVATFRLVDSGNPLFRLRSFLEVEISKMIWPPSESAISLNSDVPNHFEWTNLEQLEFFFKDMALVPTRYRSYIPSLPNYVPDHLVLRSPAFLPFRVGGIDDRDLRYQEASGSQGFERFISPLLEFDWNEPLNILPDILRWIAPFLKSTQQEDSHVISEIGLLAEMYLKGIILFVESLYMGSLFFKNYATNAAWYFERRKARGKYALVLGEDEIGPWNIAMALSKYSFDSFAIAQGHADALRIQFERNYNWIQIPTFTSREYPCYLSVRKILETLSSGRSFEKIRSLVYNWNRIWDALKFPGSVPDNIHLEALDEETLKLWYEGGSSYTACELLYQQITVDAETRLWMNVYHRQQTLLDNVSNWISKTITYNRIQSNPPFTYPIWLEAFFDDLHLIPEGFRTQITYALPPIVVVPPHTEQFLTDAELGRLQVFYRYMCRKDKCPINYLCKAVDAINKCYTIDNISHITASKELTMQLSMGLSLKEIIVLINKVLSDVTYSVLEAFKFIMQFYTFFGTPSPSGPRILAEPKLQLFNTLDIATQILDPLSGYQDRFKKISVILDRLVYIRSSDSGEAKDERPELHSQQLVKPIRDLEQRIQDWYRWWTWTTEHSLGGLAEGISLNAILWSGSLQTDWNSLQSLGRGFESLSDYSFIGVSRRNDDFSVITLVSAELSKPYRYIEEPLSPWHARGLARIGFSAARIYKYKNTRQWGHDNDADSSSGKEEQSKETSNLVSPFGPESKAMQKITSDSKGSLKRFIGKVFKEAKTIQANSG
ncbi:hypothetical protein M422DRAFT_250499 [Sphaerobolus stellatus SS14]|uniref:Uncharacterized protein n=1 Tax=Sphaerobolus stellatus (strain SS14) TaxID=990650 RepID=A0A0C9VGB9_SPHS4|nr:hypothetical protein M422DRAFT_250499 [Sphaerobolus stellatus SS14]